MIGDRAAADGLTVTIGVICAIPQELSYLLGLMSGPERHQIAKVAFGIGVLDDHPVVLAAAGMGKVNTSLVATLLADRFRCRTIVFTGVAGGLNAELQIGDVVIAERVVQHDFGLVEDEQLQPYQPGHIPFIKPTDQLGYRADPGLIERVRDRLDGFTLPPLSTGAGGHGRPPRITFGTVLTGDQYLHCERTRSRLHHEFGGHAIEMEGGALAQVCESFGIPWLVIRALSDLAGSDSGLDFKRFVNEVADGSARILLRLLPVLTRHATI
ncbi:5'-methylthioadenosine/S-adenosylhomocysteine nucleosidase [Mycobacterium kansasii]|uniref:adenosylhomocysteine nucleosidase n=3 Tax=Mycobacterium kansasii TaxID=1768 RepID=A0A653F6N3_MYCKA|nr:MTA/SAH nucleosidase [Mycobacterium kansasii ATCC 12478]KEP44768.1 MTA/SAH nucleosidase [Mycobacterium kansasii]VAZ63650.1 5'-methylthioadenosine/S-adenosylhomocysteine nucleosidase [Mycobacterium kansasii]VAZ64412.1 5'-methylthioadenosine/S-adenosylhomocysteine nucleosidase [Mycobacterium kansasii]VAZ70676.1 5'-methylthioadenosine/S-adenosylhomocysteine nucleosidase [Mycobacterium kansasii]